MSIKKPTPLSYTMFTFLVVVGTIFLYMLFRIHPSIISCGIRFLLLYFILIQPVGKILINQNRVLNKVGLINFHTIIHHIVNVLDTKSNQQKPEEFGNSRMNFISLPIGVYDFSIWTTFKLTLLQKQHITLMKPLSKSSSYLLSKL